MKGKQFLMIPGPTPVPESVLLELAKHPIGHRSSEFSKIFMRVNERLQWLAETQNDVFIYTASGTGAMEGAISNTVNSGDKVLSLVIGVFGARFADIAKGYGADVEIMKVEPGRAINPDELEARLAQDTNKEIKVVTLTHSETSTGTANNLKRLAEIIRNHGALIIVDAITSLGAMELKMDEWGIDVLVSGSQKGFMLPPGLSFIYVSKKAYEYKARNKSPNYYFCWSQAKKALKDQTTPWTPNVNFVIALDKALEMMQEEGRENIIERHSRLTRKLRKAVKELGLELLTEDETASSAITAIYPPEGISVPEIRAAFKNDWDMVVANGQKELMDKIFRIGHLGFVSDRDILTAISALENVLTKLASQKKEVIKV
jgi:aspartate aminotransferase-like enzyme